ncbi:SDR family NAD(P)-dependent oxidoreductase [Amycolatopsis sp. GM8]|uniref:SDR family NAD(P)-dependent oxidoreductase n=1 Tax=Amycolatopsis sp. GM8 TaxID=2896530 RepID=UPI001F49111A|nr:SDR family oxidoreductase [Amycolatopsis sp. GM8]
MSDRRVAFVTGASRGIGKAISVALARAGFDVAITARTVEPGEEREHSASFHSSDTSALPGSLRETATLVEKEGRQALLLQADLLDRPSLGVAAATVLERWGQVDVVVHNARYIGPGHMDTLLGAPLSVIENHMQGNFFAPLQLNKIFLPRMIERGRGRIIDLTSSSGFSDPLKPAGAGGWGISYGATKAALHRVAGILAVEHGPDGIQAFNVDPGYTATERIAQDMARFGFAANGEPPEVVGAVVAWLATAPEAAELNGHTIFAQQFCADHDLVPGYTGPQPRKPSGRPDLSGAHIAQFQEN